jgi:catechol 2,3-dioxygenase-like lactoylglutathione lyase family enzyme
MLDHISFSVNNYEESQSFYDDTLEILGYTRLMTFDTDEHKVAGYGRDQKPSFWIGSESKPNANEAVGKARGFHVAFLAPSVEAITKWHSRCLELGGQDNGAPGLRPEYYPGYYGAFIIDPNGWRIEAVLHDYQGTE